MDFHSISVENLLRLGRLSLSGPAGDDLHREVNEALCQRRTQSSEDFQPKRHCLQRWSQDWGAFPRVIGHRVLDVEWKHLRWHEGTMYAMDFKGGIHCWKPGDPASHVRQLLGQGATVIDRKVLGRKSDFAIGPTGEIFVADNENGIRTLASKMDLDVWRLTIWILTLTDILLTQRGAVRAD